MAAFSHLSGNRFLIFFLSILEACRLFGGVYEFSMGARIA